MLPAYHKVLQKKRHLTQQWASSFTAHRQMFEEKASALRIKKSNECSVMHVVIIAARKAHRMTIVDIPPLCGTIPTTAITTFI